MGKVDSREQGRRDSIKIMNKILLQNLLHYVPIRNYTNLSFEIPIEVRELMPWEEVFKVGRQNIVV